jgi:hypothetical protein
MNTNHRFQDEPLAGDDRLLDALLREHARAGSQADEAFLRRLDTALDATTAGATAAADPPRSARRGPARHLAWPLAAAAAVALAAGLLWRASHPAETPTNLIAEARSHDGTPLLTTIPPELIEGTPKAMNVPNLVQVPAASPTLFVPTGTVLLSKGRPVTSSDENPIIGSLDLITDGDKEAGEGYFVELLEGLQWVQIDLGQSAAIHAVWLWHFHSQRRAYHDVIIQVSDDPQFKTGVTTIYNNDYDDSAKLGKGADRPYVESRFGLLADAKGARGRYVRLHSNGNTSNEMNHYIEVEVFGIGG